MPDALTPYGLDFRNYLMRRYENDGRSHGFKGSTRPEFEAWQPDARSHLGHLLRMPPEMGDMELARAPVDRVGLPWGAWPDDAKYDIERVTYQTMPGVRAPAMLLIPKGISTPMPAIIASPGHGPGMRELVFNPHGVYRHYPHQLAQRGFVVMVVEHLGFGERMWSFSKSSHMYNTQASAMLGLSMHGINIAEMERAVDVLQSLPEVDSEQIGCFGMSLGGITTMLLSALDQRIKCACISGHVTSYRAVFLDDAHCSCTDTPGIALAFEHSDITSLIAPRPLVVESGTEDPTFHVDAAVDSVKKVRDNYALLDSSDKLAHDIHEGAHNISGAVAYDWFERWMK